MHVLEIIREKPFLVAILAGACAQLLKVIAFLIAEKKVNLRRFVQTDGMPNMHSATFSALTVAVGIKDGFDSLTFGLAICINSIILVDTMNVKNATSKQAEVIVLLLERLSRKSEVHSRWRGLSFTPLDVFSGLVVGVGLALIILS